MSAHTPGPWIVHGPRLAPKVVTEELWRALPQTIADARLIAAAPDMLAVLHSCEEQLVRFGKAPATLIEVREAIAKATQP
jgi:hypothetical protein